MKTVTLSTRFDENEAKIIDQLAKEDGLDRSTFLKQLLRKGLEEYKLTKALDEYRRRRISLSRAAEIADLTIRDFISRVPEIGIELNYSINDLKYDIQE